jgi:hypothetical protein
MKTLTRIIHNGSSRNRSKSRSSCSVPRIAHATIGHTDSVLRFTLHERRFMRKSRGSAIAAEVLMNNSG